MNVLFWIFCVVGVITVVLGILLPVLCAIIYGHMIHLIHILNIEWTKVKWKPKHLWWLIRMPWVNAWERLFGIERYSTSTSMGHWTYTPLFKIERTGKKKVIKD